MNTVQISITPLSYLASSANAGGPLIDIDVLYDEDTGVPYLNGKRVKGLLRESAREVMEIQGRSDEKIDQWITRVFGKSDWGQDQSALRSAPNFYLEDWADLKADLIGSRKQYKHAFSKENVLDFFTDQKVVTSVDANGIAKNKSLRTYRLIKPSTDNLNITFTGQYHIEMQDGDEEIFEKACLNLRYMGTSRNRGLGMIKVEWSDLKEEASGIPEQDKTFTSHQRLTIVNTSPIIISESSGDQNTINTGEVINGSMVRGMLVSEYLKRRPELKSNADSDDDFHNIFLSGDLTFGMAKPDGLSKVGYHIEKYKAQKPNVLINVIAKEKGDNLVSKTYGKRATINDGEIVEMSVETRLQFHNSRLERAAGRSTKDHQGIYYYESIAPGQHFDGVVSGPQELIKKLFDTVGDNFQTKIGKSKSVQYGSISVLVQNDKIVDKASVPLNQNGEYLIKAESPLLLLNNYCSPEPSVDSLLKNLGLEEVDVLNAFCKTTFVEHYNNIWQSKSLKYPAYEEGNIIHVKSDKPITGEYSVGELQTLGYGNVSITDYKINSEYKFVEESKKADINYSDANTMMQHTVSQEIYNVYSNKEMQNAIRLHAFENSKLLSQKLKRNQLSRLKSILESKHSKSEYQREFGNDNDKKKGLGNRELGKKLKQLFVFEEIKSLRLPKELKESLKDLNYGKSDFEIGKLYWMSLFTIALKTAK